MIELLRRAAAAASRPALVTDTVQLTYVDLVRRAEELAATLRATTTGGLEQSAKRVDPARVGTNGVTPAPLRFAVDSVDAEVVVPALAAASLTGAEACVFPPDGDVAVDHLLTRFGQTHLVRTSDRSDRPWELTAVTPDPAGGHAAAAADRSLRPHLVLTTGTTGEPRGVRHDWDRLLRSTDRIEFHADADSAGRWLLAYGLHQFAGLQVLLHVFAAGETLVAPAPRRPREGLAAMRRHGVTHVSATPTYWRFVLAEMRSDGGSTPQLRQITLGGEAAPGPVLAQLRRQFPDANLSHVYAASEFGATGSTKDGLPGLPADVLDRDDGADVAMKVVDGELWVRSRIGMLGYHGEAPVDADDWRPTGDLVERQGDRLLFRGRVSEIINVGGVKVHPLPIEEAVAALPGVQVARVFGRPNAMTGSIVAVEVVPVPGADAAELKAAVRDACADLPAAARPRSVTVVDDIRTAGGKIIRRQT